MTEQLSRSTSLKEDVKVPTLCLPRWWEAWPGGRPDLGHYGPREMEEPGSGDGQEHPTHFCSCRGIAAAGHLVLEAWEMQARPPVVTCHNRSLTAHQASRPNPARAEQDRGHPSSLEHLALETFCAQVKGRYKFYESKAAWKHHRHASTPTNLCLLFWFWK